jgi:hypothetical protein
MRTTQQHKHELCDAQLLSAGAGVVPTKVARAGADAVAETAAEAMRAEREHEQQEG